MHARDFDEIAAPLRSVDASIDAVRRCKSPLLSWK